MVRGVSKGFRGPELIKEIDEAIDKGLARFLIKTQSKLNKSSPVDTGRFASSWFISQGVPDTSSVAPEREEGTSQVTVTPYSGKITADSDWWIQNNLPYAERVCFDPKWAKNGAGGAGWFTTIANNLTKQAERDLNYFLRKVK